MDATLGALLLFWPIPIFLAALLRLFIWAGIDTIRAANNVADRK